MRNQYLIGIIFLISFSGLFSFYVFSGKLGYDPISDLEIEVVDKNYEVKNKTHIENINIEIKFKSQINKEITVIDILTPCETCLITILESNENLNFSNIMILPPYTEKYLKINISYFEFSSTSNKDYQFNLTVLFNIEGKELSKEFLILL